jgi:hypothetical protein
MPTTDQRRERIVATSRRYLREMAPSEKVSAILKTEDVPGTIEWYRRVGFRLEGVFPENGEPTWCELSRDGVVLQFLGGETPWPDSPAFTGTLYFYPESVDALHEIKGHTQPAWGPEVRDWGSRELGLRDPNGYFLTFTEAAEPRTDRAEDGPFAEA